jgi:hypothetical protein
MGGNGASVVGFSAPLDADDEGPTEQQAETG